MRRIYFVADTVTDQIIPDLTLSVELWESSYQLIMAAPVGKNLHNLWRHHFGTEAEMRVSGNGLLKLENGIKKLLSIRPLSVELNAFLCDLSSASARARAKRYNMVVIAE